MVNAIIYQMSAEQILVMAAFMAGALLAVPVALVVAHRPQQEERRPQPPTPTSLAHRNGSSIDCR